MATATQTQEQEMTAEAWFNGGQEAALNRLNGIKGTEERRAALHQFNELNSAFMEERSSREQAPPGPGEKARTHPAIEEAINEAMSREKGWVKDIAGLSDQQLVDRYLDRAMKRDVARNRADVHITLGEYKAQRPDLVEIAGKFTRAELERKEFLSRMILDRRFNVSKAKVEYERKLNPQLVAVAEKNLGNTNQRGPRYNDALFAEVSKVKKTFDHAKSVGVRF